MKFLDMKVKDFIEMIRPITMCNPESDIKFIKVHPDSPQTTIITSDSVELYLKVE